MSLSEFEVTVTNDGKEKHHSFEAEIDLSIYLNGYGSTKEEAIDDLKHKIDNIIYNLKEIDWETDVREKY